MVGLVLENIINVAMSNHLYQFANTVRKQEDTGPTGFDMTGLAADLYLIWWDGKFQQWLKDLNIKTDINCRFKDDISIMTDLIPLGTRYDRKSRDLHYTNPSLKCFGNFKNDAEKEIYESKNAELLTFHILHEIANDIDSMISFTYDIPSNYSDNKVPILDLNVFVNQDGLICHEFYMKSLLKMSLSFWQVQP